ncbi:uncharacterized protein PGTG_13917 [Puccinia graminis f. sp. tritici CRL 75-36-700-3]|uniref:Uncharacterized protein n=1 Tax=Puccinia graminis f. sp. tritici (strain CRL 75-36-700-3 / race SCCL) TaxID=418459 RepID=E3KTC1_PUCGT|nr:uncharacterized protein PGTG_13917 [Puccinia graminis f. sp. tritici CRL 75-36-700-3]EFP87546.2 hypothetical protein PGTG_13917 [Puccinia graminis f. sp. tritici CRL 75-36-700-3]
MAQPLPEWLKPVTLRYQDSDKVTTGLVELPITYSGPSIPLSWPFTSIQANPLTASPAAPSALPSPQVVRFIDGSGPFTILGDVILTAPIPAQTASVPITASPSPPASAIPAAPSPSVVLVTTVIVAQPNPNTTQTTPDNSNSPAYNPLALGFVLLLAILIILILAATFILIKRQRRRRKHVGMVDKYDDSAPQEIHYAFNSRLYPQHHHGSQTQPHYVRHSQEHDNPAMVREEEHLCLQDADTKEKDIPTLQTEFLLTPQRQPVKRSQNKWARLKKFVPKLPMFGKTLDRPDFAYNQPLPKTTPIYVNPYHDPSVNTNTGERVSRWRMACGSLSSSALKLPSTITSYNNELPVHKDFLEQETPVKDPEGLPNDPKSAVSAIQRGEAKLVFSYNQSSTVSGPTGKPQTRAYQALKESPPTSPLKAKSMEAVYSLLELTSPRHVKPPTLKPKKSIIPTGLFKSQGNPSRSFGTRTKSSRTTGKGSASKRYSDASPPLLVAECEDEGSGSDGTDPGDSPLDFITIPLRSPPRCRRGTPSSSVAITGLDNSFDSISCPRSLPPSSPSIPLPSSAKRVRPKKNSLPAFPQPPITSQLSTSNSGDDQSHIVPLRRAPCSSSPVLLPSLPITRALVPKTRDESSPTKLLSHARSHYRNYSPAVKNEMSANDSSLDTNLGHEAHRYDRTRTEHSKDSSRLMNSSSSNEITGYPKDPSFGTSDGISLAHPEPHPTKTGSRETRNSSASDEDIVFNGYFGSGSIGNTGGVSELGILDSSMRGTDHSLSREIEMDAGFPVSIQECPAGKTREGSVQLVDGDEYSYNSGDLFYVKPQLGRPSGSRWVHTTTQATSPPKYQALSKVLPSSKSKTNLKDITEESTSRISYQSEAGQAQEPQNLTESDRRNERVTELRRSHKSHLSTRVPSSCYSTDPEEVARRASRRSVSSSVLGSIFSLAKGRRCVSYPTGLSNESESSGMNHAALDIEPMLNDARSPLQRIAEKCRHPSGSSEEEQQEGEGDADDDGEPYGNRRRSSGEEEEEEEHSEGDEEEEADEGCRLLFARPALSSTCSRATLGQRMVTMRTTEQHAPNTHSYHAPVHTSPTAISPPPTASGQPLLIQTLETPPRSHSSHPSSR